MASNHTAAMAEAEAQQVLHTLIQEAQQEIGRLRAELYSTTRLADERKWVAPTAAADLLPCTTPLDSVSVRHDID